MLDPLIPDTEQDLVLSRHRRRFLLVAGPIACLAAGTLEAQLQSTPGWFVNGGQFAAGLGSSVAAAGDVNGDGYGDLAVCAYRYDGNQVDEGLALVFLGSPRGLSRTPSWTMESNQAYATISAASAAGDGDGDGYGDLVVGSYFHSHDLYLEGRAYLFRGSPSGLSMTPSWVADGNQQGAAFGSQASGVGDVNGDGYDDVLIAASGWENGQQAEGAVFLYLGSPAGLGATPAWSAEGNQRFSGFGSGGRAGDVNGDGFDDLIIGAGGFNHGEVDEGRVFLYLGSPAGPSLVADWTAESDQASAFFGSYVGAAGDVNGDGYDDVIVGATNYDSPPLAFTPEGRAYLYLGSPAGLSWVPDWTAEGMQVGESFGAVAGTGDLDGDGYDDVIVGAPGHRRMLKNEGRVCVYFGSAAGLSALPSWQTVGGQREAALGDALAGAGDVNGDGYADLILGAWKYDFALKNEGRAFVFHGASDRRLR